MTGRLSISTLWAEVKVVHDTEALAGGVEPCIFNDIFRATRGLVKLLIFDHR